MITFLEYSHNLDQVSQIFKQLAGDKQTQPVSQIKDILRTVPPDFVDKLPDTARADAALVFVRILSSYSEGWDELGVFVKSLWDQPVKGQGKTLGKTLLNLISAKVMEMTGSEFFISYSGSLSRSAIFDYTGKYVRCFESNSNYTWGDLKRIFNTIKSDYAELFNNYRQSQIKR